MNAIHLPDYMRDEIQFITQCYDIARRSDKTLSRTDFCLLYVETPFPELYQQYWHGNRHKPKPEMVARACLEERLD